MDLLADRSELEAVKAVWEAPEVRSLESPDIEGGPFPSTNETLHAPISSPYGALS